MELAFPFKDLIHGTFKATAPPKDKDTWRINFSRSASSIFAFGIAYVLCTVYVTTVDVLSLNITIEGV